MKFFWSKFLIFTIESFDFTKGVVYALIYSKPFLNQESSYRFNETQKTLSRKDF